MRRPVPKPVRRRHLFKAATFDLYEQILDFGPGRRRVPWYMITHPGAASVLPVLADGRIVMLRQYRPAIRKWLWEVPCGTLKVGEDPRAGAARELAEEAGYTGRLRTLAAFYSAPGFCDERMFCYVADRLRPVPVNHDPDERIVIRPMRPDAVRRLLAAGGIADAKTLVCLLAYFAGRGASPAGARAGGGAGRKAGRAAPRRPRGTGRALRRGAGS